MPTSQSCLVPPRREKSYCACGTPLDKTSDPQKAVKSVFVLNEYCLAGSVFVRFEYFVVTPSGDCVGPGAIFWTTKYSKSTKRDRAVQGAWGAFKMEGSEGGVVDVLRSGLGEAR
jgi:hypothetical protein